MFKQHISELLSQREQQGLLRSRTEVQCEGSRLSVDGKTYVNFAGNDYLGLATAHDNNKAGRSGATASPLVTGRAHCHIALENELLTWLEAPSDFACMLFSSGFSANTGVISALFNTKNADARLLQDKLNHASLMDAGKHVQALGHCRQLRFAHQDTERLANLLVTKCSANSPKLVVTEGVFSMDGDSPDLAKLKTICEQNQAWFMLDDAHGVGVQGEQGRGTFAAQGIELSESDILVTTFGKAVGAQGAAVLAHKDTIDYLTNFSREYIYSTHLSPLQTEAVLHNISVLRQEDWRQAKLQQNIALFRELANGLPFDLLASHSPIQPILIGEEDKAVAIAQKLKEKGIWVGAMRYPTVAKDQARLRVTITTNHDEQDIRLLVEELARLGENLNA